MFFSFFFLTTSLSLSQLVFNLVLIDRLVTTLPVAELVYEGMKCVVLCQ